MPKAYEQLVARVPIRLLEADWILRSFVDEVQGGGLYEIGKRTIDIFGGLIGSMITLLLFPILALAIVVDDGSPIIYTQNSLRKRRSAL